MTTGSFDAYMEQWDSYGSYADYQDRFPEFNDLTQQEALVYWQNKYRDSYLDMWAAKAAHERSVEVGKNLMWWGTAMQFSFLAADSAGGPRLGTPRTFSFTPRGQGVK